MPSTKLRPGAEDGSDDDGAGERGACVGCERGLDRTLDGLEVAGDFEGHQRGEFAKLPAKFFRGGGAVADDGEFYPDEGMVDDGDAVDWSVALLGHSGWINKRGA